jgi:hypothetical protein
MFALNRNPEFRDYSGAAGNGDCTNFVSQCLYAGGWTFLQPPVISPNPTEWWFDARWRENSRTWSSASWFTDFLERSNRVTSCTLGELVPGDIIGHDDSTHGGHYMFATGILSNPPLHNLLLSYHTTDRLDFSFSDVMVLLGVEGYRYWHVNDIFDDSYITRILH